MQARQSVTSCRVNVPAGNSAKSSTSFATRFFGASAAPFDDFFFDVSAAPFAFFAAPFAVFAAPFGEAFVAPVLFVDAAADLAAVFFAAPFAPAAGLVFTALAFAVFFADVLALPPAAFDFAAVLAFCVEVFRLVLVAAIVSCWRRCVESGVARRSGREWPRRGSERGED